MTLYLTLKFNDNGAIDIVAMHNIMSASKELACFSKVLYFGKLDMQNKTPLLTIRTTSVK